MQALGHPVVGDTLYGAAAKIRVPNGHTQDALELHRNFLHAAHLEFVHPRTGVPVVIDVGMPEELDGFVRRLRDGVVGVG
jgi:23S rRNA pseudouridine1911/1915/1917 synthase